MRTTIRKMMDELGYSLSLPERIVRSLVAVAGGATKIVSDVIVPAPLRGSRTYQSIVGNTQRFLIERVAEVEGVYEADAAALPDDYVARKVAGNVMEAAGIFSMHLSPLWVFAIVSDVAGGSRAYLQRLTDELKRDNVIDDSAPVTRLNDLFDAIAAAGKSSADVFDAPPVSQADLQKLREQLTDGYGNVFAKAGDLMPRIDEMWSRMQSVSDGPAAMTRLAGLMTMDVTKLGGQAASGLLAAGRATGDAVGELMLDSYAESLARVEERGLMVCLDEATAPYTRAFARQYSRAQKSWTERVIVWVMERVLGRRPEIAPAAALPLDPGSASPSPAVPTSGADARIASDAHASTAPAQKKGH